MDWYYAQEGLQAGPVSDAEIESLVHSGKISRDTLVWHEGMADWMTYGAVNPILRDVPVPQPPPSPEIPPSPEVLAGMRACVECGRAFQAEEMIQYGSAWVCAACKPVFFQRLKEGAPIRGELVYGRFWTRFSAKILDGLIYYAFQSVVMLAIFGARGAFIGRHGAAWILVSLVTYGFPIAYTTFFLGKYGATPGKMATGLMVVTPDGQPISYLRAFARFWSELLSLFTLYIGYIMAAFDEEKRTLHDRICNTRVVLKSSVPS